MHRFHEKAKIKTSPDEQPKENHKMSHERAAYIRYILTGFFFVVLVITIVFNGLAGPGNDPFTRSTGDISALYPLCITPTGSTFAIWGVIYFFLAVIAVYAITILFRKVDNEPVYKLGGAVSIEYLAIMVVNFAFNIGWLFAWDALNLIGSSCILFIIAITNATADSIAAFRFMNAASQLYEKSKVDFYFNIIVMNGQGLYTVWTFIAALLNLGIAIAYHDNVGSFNIQENICLTILSLILAVFIIYFIAEQTVLKRITNTIFSHYIVYLWAMTGAYMKNKDFGSDGVVNLLIANVSFAAILLFARIGFLFYFNRSNRVYASKIN